MHEEALDIQLFGGLRVVHCGRLLTQLGATRQQALLAWLLLHADRPQSRKRIAFVFWPDSSERQALANLRRELHYLRRLIPAVAACLDVSPQALCWRADACCSVDTLEFERALAAAADADNADEARPGLERAVSLYRGELLAGLQDEWIMPFRQSFHERVAEALASLASLYEHHAEFGRALGCTQRLLALEPMHESSYARLMRLHLARGERISALQVFDRCSRVLAQELGTRPGDAVQRVYRELRQETPPPARPDELPLIGRRAEWAGLLGQWDQLRQGGALAVAISGEAGIGKTRLAEALLAQAADEGAITARTRSYAAEGRLAFAPLTEWLRSPMLQANLARLEPPWLGEIARLLPELLQQYPELSTPQPLSQGWQRQQLFEALARAFVVEHSPTLLLFDDLQWCDRDTLEWLHYLLRFAPTAPLLLLGTLRGEEQDDNPALGELLSHLQQEALLQRVELGPLDRVASAALAESVADESLDAAVQTGLFTATEGQPLFIVEAVRAGFDPGSRDKREVIAASPRVQAVIAARLAQLSVTAREVAQVASTIGRAFDVDVLRLASGLDEAALAGALDELWRRAMIRQQQGGTSTRYDFSHNRLREGAYGQLSPARRRLLHWYVGQALETVNSASPHRVSAELAAHYEQAEAFDKAIAYYQQAVERADDICASREAIRLARRALLLLQQRPAGSERDRRELALQEGIATALTSLRGFTPRTLEAVLNRERQLGEALADWAAVIRSLWGLFALHLVRGDVDLARGVGEEGLKLAGDDPGLLTDCHHALGGVELTEGNLTKAQQHFATTNRLYRRHGARRMLFGADVGVFSLTWSAHGLWLQGEVEQARDNVAEGWAIAKQLGHPFTSAQGSAYRSIYWQFEHHLDNAWACAEETVAVGDEYNIRYYREWGVIVGGWVQARRGDADTGAARIRRGLSGLREQDAYLRRPYYLSLLAEVCLQAGDPDQARALLDAAMTLAQQNRDLWWLPELWRLRGLTVSGAETEICCRRALEIAHGQGSRSLALRAVTSLAAWLRDRGQPRQAVAQLEPVCGGFPDALESHDLSAARTLLDKLA